MRWQWCITSNPNERRASGRLQELKDTADAARPGDSECRVGRFDPSIALPRFTMGDQQRGIHGRGETLAQWADRTVRPAVWDECPAFEKRAPCWPENNRQPVIRSGQAARFMEVSVTKVQEIRERHEIGETTKAAQHGVHPHGAIHDDRSYLLDLVARLSACLNEFAVCTPVMDDERLRYVEIQVSRDELADAKALVEEAK